MLESLEVIYVPMSSYSMRLHAVRLTELLFIPRLRVLRIVVPGLYDEADAASFLGPIFMGQLRKCKLEEIDITLITDQDGEFPLLQGCQGILRLALSLHARQHHRARLLQIAFLHHCAAGVEQGMTGFTRVHQGSAATTGRS